jgi:hypothetical protein
LGILAQRRIENSKLKIEKGEEPQTDTDRHGQNGEKTTGTRGGEEEVTVKARRSEREKSEEGDDDGIRRG